jgi:asparagine synthase (glutamine-hydrolysing)
VLAALGARQSRDKLHAITLGFREYRGTLDDETPLAEKHAQELGIRQTTRWIERSDFRDEWRSFFAGMDQASTDGVNSYLVSNARCASGLKVAISGLGGDELFGGYPSFRDVPRMRRWCRARLASAGRCALSSAASRPRDVAQVRRAAGIRLDPRRCVSAAPRAVHAVGASTPDGTRARCRRARNAAAARAAR